MLVFFKKERIKKRFGLNPDFFLNWDILRLYLTPFIKTARIQLQNFFGKLIVTNSSRSSDF